MSFSSLTCLDIQDDISGSFLPVHGPFLPCREDAPPKGLPDGLAIANLRSAPGSLSTLTLSAEAQTENFPSSKSARFTDMNKFGSLIVRVARAGAGLVGEGQSAVPGARECGVRDFCA